LAQAELFAYYAEKKRQEVNRRNRGRDIPTNMNLNSTNSAMDKLLYFDSVKGTESRSIVLAKGNFIATINPQFERSTGCPDESIVR
jgi:hypothetical protein